MELLSLRRKVKDTNHALMASLTSLDEVEKNATDYAEALRLYREFIFRDLSLTGKPVGNVQTVHTRVPKGRGEVSLQAEQFPW